MTTFAGLAVAIPAATLAHVFEGRIQNLFRELDETLLRMLPQLKRLKRRLRTGRSRLDPSASRVESTGESRIQDLFGELDETILGMLSQLDRLERRLRERRSRSGPSASPVVGIVGNCWNAGARQVVRRR